MTGDEVACINAKDLAAALWQAYYHNELDKFAQLIWSGKPEGNDHPCFLTAAKAIMRRIE